MSYKSKLEKARKTAISDAGVYFERRVGKFQGVLPDLVMVVPNVVETAHASLYELQRSPDDGWIAIEYAFYQVVFANEYLLMLIHHYEEDTDGDVATYLDSVAGRSEKLYSQQEVMSKNVSSIIEYATNLDSALQVLLSSIVYR